MQTINFQPQNMNEKEVLTSDHIEGFQQALDENTETWVSFLTPKKEVDTRFETHGTIKFDWIGEDLEQAVEQSKPIEEKPNQLESSSTVRYSKDGLFSGTFKIVKLSWSFFKGLFEGFLSVIKQSSEKVLTPEQQKAKEERQKKEQERKANIKAFYEALKINLTKFNEQKYKIRLENRQRLGITNLDIATTNQLLSGENGPMRNLSDTDISYDYHDEHAAIAMVEKRRADQVKQATKELASPAKKLAKGPRLIMDMDKQHLSKGGTVTTAGG